MKRLLVTYNYDLYYSLVLWIYPKSMALDTHFCFAKLSMKRHIVLYTFLFFVFSKSSSWASFSLSFNFCTTILSCFENFSQNFELMVRPWTKQQLMQLNIKYVRNVQFEIKTYILKLGGALLEKSRKHINRNIGCNILVIKYKL